MRAHWSTPKPLSSSPLLSPTLARSIDLAVDVEMSVINIHLIYYDGYNGPIKGHHCIVQLYATQIIPTLQYIFYPVYFMIS